MLETLKERKPADTESAEYEINGLSFDPKRKGGQELKTANSTASLFPEGIVFTDSRPNENTVRSGRFTAVLAF